MLKYFYFFNERKEVSNSKGNSYFSIAEKLWSRNCKYCDESKPSDDKRILLIIMYLFQFDANLFFCIPMTYKCTPISPCFFSSVISPSVVNRFE